jgi:hypothetical protein
MKSFVTTNVTHTKQAKEASTRQQQGFKPIGEILKRLPLIPDQE